MNDDAAPISDRTRAARVLSRWPAGEDILTTSAGRGQGEFRIAIMRLLASGGTERAPLLRQALLDTPRVEIERRGDLAEALAQVASRAPSERGATRQLLVGLLDQGEPFEIRARAARALAHLSDDETWRELIRFLRTESDGVMRRIFARELAHAPAPIRGEALRPALTDADPGVRETAAKALGPVNDPQTGERLVAAAKTERWPFVRRTQLLALAELCPLHSKDVLWDAMKDPFDQVRAAALTGVSRCRDPRANEALLFILGRAPENPTMRGTAASLLGERNDPQVGPRMAEILARLRVESQAELALEGVALVTLRTLAALGGKAAVTGAVALAEDERPHLKKAALETLGRLCDPTAGAAALQKARKHPDPIVADTAAASLRRCGEPR